MERKLNEWEGKKLMGRKGKATKKVRGKKLNKRKGIFFVMNQMRIF